MSREVQTLYVAEAEDGIRLDRWFRRRWPHLSNIQVQKMARSGQIRVDGARMVAVNLSSARLDGASLAGADLRRAVMVDADLSRATLHGAQTKQADFTGAQTSGARGLDPADLHAA